MQNYQKNNQGRSMIEMLGVLAIIGVLSIVALVGFTYAMNKHRANTVTHDVMLLATEVLLTGKDTVPSDFYPASNKQFDIALTADGFEITASDVTDAVYDRIEELVQDPIEEVRRTGQGVTYVFGLETSGSGGPAPDPAPEPDLCDGLVCQHGGSCLDGVCRCVNGYSGTYCEIEPDACYGITCNGHGTCSEGDCACTDGYSGTYCEIEPDACYGVTCNGHGTCSGGVCTCEDGYIGDNCETEDKCYGVTLTDCQLSCDSLTGTITNKEDGTECTTSDNVAGTCQEGVCQAAAETCGELNCPGGWSCKQDSSEYCEPPLPEGVMQMICQKNICMPLFTPGGPYATYGYGGLYLVNNDFSPGMVAGIYSIEADYVGTDCSPFNEAFQPTCGILWNYWLEFDALN